EVDGSVLHGPAVGQDVGAEVRFVGGIHVVVIRHQIEVVADLPEGGECRPLALLGGGAAVGDILVGVQQGGAHREVVGDALVAVEAVALVAVGAEADLRLVEVVLGAGSLGDAVHPAAGGTAPGEGGAGALGDFDLFHREAFPGGHARVPQAVDEYVAAGLVAADDVAVAEGVAVLAGAEGDAGLGGEDVLQVGLAGFLHQGLGQHADGLRGFRQVLDAAPVAGFFRLVGGALFGVGVGVGGALLDLQGIQ